MAFWGKDLDIAKNIKIIEGLKSQILSDVSQMFSIMLEHTKDMPAKMIDILANMILLSYLLGKRLGISYQAMDMKIQSKLKLGIVENNDTSSEWYAELAELSKHLDKTRDRIK